MYINTTTLQYPLSEHDVRASFPNTSFATPFVAPDGYSWVFPAPAPAHDAVVQYARETAPVLTVKGTWEQQWKLVDRYATQDEADAAVAADTLAKQAALQASIVQATQLRLDEFAQTRNYDGILAACTYATSTVPQFQAEGQACVEARDATWSTLYTLLAEVQAGTRPMPSSYADIESLLPALAWPA
jgi:hypothetical protein